MFVAWTLWSGRALAQATPPTDRSFDVQLFQYAISPGSFLTVDTAEVPANKQFGLSLSTGYVRSPFTIYTESGDGSSSPIEVVKNQVWSELSGAVGVADKLQLGIAIPFFPSVAGDDFSSAGKTSGDLKKTALGDIRVEGKVHIATVGPDDEIVMSVAPGFTLPTGDQAKFTGDKTVTGRLRWLTELRRGDLRVGGMAGLLVRKESHLFAATVGQQILWGLAGAYKITPQVAGVVEIFGRSGLNDFTERWVDANPVEMDAAVRVNISSFFSLTAGGGTGLVKGIGAPKARGFLALGWAPDFRDRDKDGVYDVDDRCPDQLEDRDGFRDEDGCPEADNDGDSLPDAQDKCPNDAEDLDQFEDEDGCPEADNDKDGFPDINDPCPNAAEDGQGKKPKDGCPSTAEDADGDGVPDIKDKCPDEPEDRDGFEDDDGCPDPDNDGDSMPDNFDNCPDEAEDADGFEDDDGCPEPDNDRDGFLDKDDKCPSKSETLNGRGDEDGCPDSGNPIARLEGSKIIVDERIGFVSKAGKSEVKEASLPLVHLVALIMRGNPEIATLRIDVWAEGVPKEETQVRAEALRQALAAKGVQIQRLKAQGMGGGAAKVEFVVESMTPPKKKGGSEPAPSE